MYIVSAALTSREGKFVGSQAQCFQRMHHLCKLVFCVACGLYWIRGVMSQGISTLAGAGSQSLLTGETRRLIDTGKSSF